MLERVRHGSAVRVGGRIVNIPLASRVREIDFGTGVKTAIAIPWGDVSTAFHTTGIPNIEVYIPASPHAVRRLQRLDRWKFVLGFAPLRRWLGRRANRGVPGPGVQEREKTPVMLWGEGRNAAGRTIVGRLQVANGYTTTVHSTLGMVERMLLGTTPTGYRTPSQVMGADFVSSLPGATGVTLGDR